MLLKTCSHLRSNDPIMAATAIFNGKIPPISWMHICQERFWDFPKNHVSFFGVKLVLTYKKFHPSISPYFLFALAITCYLLRSLMYNPNIVQRLLNNIPMSLRSWDSHLDTIDHLPTRHFSSHPEERRKITRLGVPDSGCPDSGCNCCCSCCCFCCNFISFCCSLGDARTSRQYVESTLQPSGIECYISQL